MVPPGPALRSPFCPWLQTAGEFSSPPSHMAVPGSCKATHALRARRAWPTRQRAAAHDSVFSVMSVDRRPVVAFTNGISSRSASAAMASYVCAGSGAQARTAGSRSATKPSQSALADELACVWRGGSPPPEGSVAVIRGVGARRTHSTRQLCTAAAMRREPSCSARLTTLGRQASSLRGLSSLPESTRRRRHAARSPWPSDPSSSCTRRATPIFVRLRFCAGLSRAAG